MNKLLMIFVIVFMVNSIWTIKCEIVNQDLELVPEEALFEEALLPEKVKESNGSKTISSIHNRGTLLEDHFGVYPTLINHSTAAGGDGNIGQTEYSFDWASLIPTKHTETVTWVESDYYGQDGGTPTHHGSFPSGGERYDVEALYFDNDNDNFYIAIITSVPHYWDYSGNAGVGIMDSRYSNLWVRPGDISLDLGLGTARVERNSTSWHYNYGLDITHENRDVTTSYGSYPSCDMRDNLIGSELYRTYADAGGSNIINPASGTSDWHSSLRNGIVDAYWEHTNFDPYSSNNLSSSPMTPVGDSSDGIVVAYYNLTFTGGYLENGQETFIIEATIPRSLFGADNPGVGDTIGFRYMPGCRNDGNGTTATVKLTTIVEGFATLGDIVWHDINEDGIQDGYETGVENVTVNLYNSSNSLIRTMNTDANGNYLFENLIPGSYYVEFLPPTGWVVSPRDVGSDVLDSDANPNPGAGYGQTGVYTLAADDDDRTVDCGIYDDNPVPVTLSTFNADFYYGNPRLQWVTQSESNNAFWNIYRAASENVGQAVKINYEVLNGAGTTSEPTEYNFIDHSLDDYIQSNNMINPTIYFWIESVSNDGNSELHGPISLQINNSNQEYSTPEIPDKYGLYPNYPNPFNPDTTIIFNLKKDEKASLVIYNVKGELVKTIFQDRECIQNRTYIETWRGKDNKGNTVSSGIYLAILKTDSKLFTRKMILQK